LFVRKITAVLGVLVLIIFVLGIVSYSFRHSDKMQELLLSSNIKASREIHLLDNKINSFPVEDISEERLSLTTEIDNFVESSISGKVFSAKPYLLIKLRLDRAMKEISNREFGDKETRLWYLYNMGVIVKSGDASVAFDLPNTSIYGNLAD